MDTPIEEYDLLEKLKEWLAEAGSLFDGLVERHKQAIKNAVRKALPDCPEDSLREIIIASFTRCRNEIVACRLPEDFGAQAAQLASELCHDLQQRKRLRDVRPEILAPIELEDLTPAAQMVDMDEEEELLNRFKGQIRAIKEGFWQVIQSEHLRADGTTADKRTLLVQYALKRGMSPEEAEDLAGDVLEKALTLLWRYEPRPGKGFMNWLYTVAHHALIDACRRKERAWLQEPETEPQPPDAKSIHRKALEELVAAQALSQLLQLCAREPQGSVKALICFFHQVLGYKPQEIASELGELSLRELLEEFEKACLQRLEAFDGNEEWVTELFEPLRVQIEEPYGPGRKVGDQQLKAFWQHQKRVDYYIQNVSRRTWKRVAERVKAELHRDREVDEVEG